jgi:DNA-binding beta-propeller fold protein YncE
MSVAEKVPVVGSGKLRYTAHADWASLPPGASFVEVVGIATDADDCAYVFSRGEQPVMVFAPDGRYLRGWGENVFTRPHGITIAPDGSIYCTDDQDHTVRKFSPEGKLLMTLGTSGQPSDTGIDGMDYRTIRRPAGPFNMPCNLAIAPDGGLYVCDGYGNARVHRFTAEGKYELSWGEVGDHPGAFNLPHGIAVDRQSRVYVADRENSRIQIFSPEGKFLTQWTDTGRPMQVFIDANDLAYVCDVGFRAGRFPWNPAPPEPVRGAYTSIFDLEGKLLSRWGGSADPCAAGDFFAPHGICVDSKGAIYVGEVVMSAGGRKGLVPATCHSLQKFVPVAG